MTTVHHGGRLLAAQRAHPRAPTPWLDLSTGINPVPFPVGAIPDAAWTRLPETEELRALEKTAAQAYGVADPACVVAAPGAQSLIGLLPLLMPARRVFVCGPTYEEHAARWRASGATVAVGVLASRAGAHDTVVVVTPNNPDGAVLSRETLAELADAAARHPTGLLVIDESFVDALPSPASFAPLIGDRPVVVLRSVGKMYGLAGLRLGFAVAPARLAARLRGALGPWAVSGAAIAVGTRALADMGWLARTRARLQADAARLDGLLVQAGCTLVGGTPLFRLARHPHAAAVHRGLCERGILTRTFADRPDLLRVGLPPPQAWDRLAEALVDDFATPNARA